LARKKKGATTKWRECLYEMCLFYWEKDMEQGYRELLQLLNDHQKELSAAKKVESGLLIQMLSFLSG